jgi:hypothetical protein
MHTVLRQTRKQQQHHLHVVIGSIVAVVHAACMTLHDFLHRNNNQPTHLSTTAQAVANIIEW